MATVPELLRESWSQGHHGAVLLGPQGPRRPHSGVGDRRFREDLLLHRDGLQAATLPGVPGFPGFAPKAKRVIYLFMNGGPTHVDLFDWKPQIKALHGKPVPDSYVGGKRFSTMTGAAGGKLMLAPVEPQGK